uniref:Uncharacterized protein n=1 Tax=Parascaris equorum TaxID=6256 RepID=A0A914S713_PAREQ
MFLLVVDAVFAKEVHALRCRMKKLIEHLSSKAKPQQGRSKSLVAAQQRSFSAVSTSDAVLAIEISHYISKDSFHIRETYTFIYSAL